MLYIPLDKSARRTYTKQIYYAIREKILAGELRAGEALPPYRELSQDLAVSKNTVLSAYDMLVAEGMLRSVAGSGFYVAAGVRRLPPPALVPPPQSAALTDIVIPDGAINFDNGCPALELFPRAKWSRALSAAVAEAPVAALGYDLPQGRPELRLALAAQCLLSAAGEVWIEDPAPALLRQMLQCRMERIVPLPVDAHGLDPARFPAGRKPALIICSPARQFPTGAIMPMTRRMELVAFAKRTGAYLLEDNFESEFNYDAPPTSSLFELAPECVLSVGTFSKVLFPSVRLGYLVAPRQLVASLCAQKRLSDHHTNSLDQLALAAFLRDGELERHTRRMKKEYRARRDCLTDCLRAQFGPGVHISGGAAGMNLVAAFDGVDCTDALVRRMLQQGVYAVPVEQQAAVKGLHKNELILRYSGLTRAELALGAARLKAAIVPD